MRTEARSTVHQCLWFVLIWAGGVLALGSMTLLLRTVMGWIAHV